MNGRARLREGTRDVGKRCSSNPRHQKVKDVLDSGGIGALEPLRHILHNRLTKVRRQERRTPGRLRHPKALLTNVWDSSGFFPKELANLVETSVCTCKLILWRRIRAATVGWTTEQMKTGRRWGRGQMSRRDFQKTEKRQNDLLAIDECSFSAALNGRRCESRKIEERLWRCREDQHRAIHQCKLSTVWYCLPTDAEQKNRVRGNAREKFSSIFETIHNSLRMLHRKDAFGIPSRIRSAAGDRLKRICDLASRVSDISQEFHNQATSIASWIRTQARRNKIGKIRGYFSENSGRNRSFAFSEAKFALANSEVRFRKCCEFGREYVPCLQFNKLICVSRRSNDVLMLTTYGTPKKFNISNFRLAQKAVSIQNISHRADTDLLKAKLERTGITTTWKGLQSFHQNKEPRSIFRPIAWLPTLTARIPQPRNQNGTTFTIRDPDQHVNFEFRSEDKYGRADHVIYTIAVLTIPWKCAHGHKLCSQI